MNKTTDDFSSEDIKRHIAATRATVKQARDLLAQARTGMSRLAPEAEALQKTYESLHPSSREWIDNAVRLGIQGVNRVLSGAEQESASQPSRPPRKRRSMV